MKNNIFYAMLFSMLLFSCAENKNDAGNINISDVAKTLDKEQAAINSCIGSYTDKLDELFTLDMVASTLGLPKEEAKTTYSKAMKDTKYHSLQYAWESSRIKLIDVGVVKTKVPLPNLVTISGIEEMDEEKFDKYYKNLSPDEKKEAKELMERSLERQAEKKKLTDLQKKMANDLAMKSIDNIKFEAIPGIGTKAMWDARRNELYVLHGNTKFLLTADLSDDADKNKASAILLAKAVVDVCK